MSKRVTKTSIVLDEARARMKVAEDERDSIKFKLDRAQSRFEAYKEAYESLERALTRAPKSPSPAPSAGKKSSRQKTLTGVGVPSLETETGGVISVGGSGD